MITEQIEITPYDTPWEIACMIINAKYKATNIFNNETVYRFFEIEDLRRIGEHIVNYCDTEKERCGENGIQECRHI